MKIRVDQGSFTIREMRVVEELLGKPLSEGVGESQPLAMAAMACVAARRDDPGFTFDQALDLRMDEIEMITPDDVGEAHGGDNGAQPRSSPGPGLSTLPT